MDNERKTAHNEPSADNAGSFRRLAFTKLANEEGNKKQTTSKSRTAAAGGELAAT